jgi:Domain of unknown function (DUF4386)
MQMTARTDEISPQRYARIAGVLYLLIIATGIFGEIFVRGQLIVAGDPSATAQQIMAAPLLWLLGIASDIIMQLCDIPVMLVFYLLLRPVHKNLALAAMLFNLIQTAVLVVNKLTLVVPLFLLEPTAYLQAFDLAQRHLLAYLLLKTHNYGFGIGLIFFGFTCLVNGYLIFRSGYLPRIFGILLQLAGLSYLVNSFALLLAPPVLALISPAILLLPFVGELSFALWLLLKGVNVERWQQRVIYKQFQF